MMEDYLISKLEVLGDSDHNLTSNAIYLIYKIRPYILNISLERNCVSVDFELTNNNKISNRLGCHIVHPRFFFKKIAFFCASPKFVDAELKNRATPIDGQDASY